MTRPGDPGHAAASREAHTAAVAVVADDTGEGLDALEPMGLDAVYLPDDHART